MIAESLVRVCLPHAGARALATVALWLGLPVLVQAQALGRDTVIASAPSGGSLRAGDEVHVQIWREPELSGEFQVDEAGIVVFPKIGRLDVSGEHPASLKERLLRAYRVYLVNPSIQVQVRRRINVLGAVKNPDLYEVDPTITVADALALAGGVATAGRANRVELRRRGGSGPVRLSGRALLGDARIESGDQLFVPERSWISRNPGFVIGAIGLVSTVLWRVAR